MKRLLTLLATTLALLIVQTSFGTTINVSIGDNGFDPPNFTANIGDVIQWTAASGNQWQVNSASILVPNGAATWSSGVMNPTQTFSYTVTTAGSYSYQSTAFYNLSATFSVNAPQVTYALHNITIMDDSFSPSYFTAAVGDTIVWTSYINNLWTTNSASTQVPPGAATWSSPILNNGDSYRYVITTPGFYMDQSTAFYDLNASFLVTGPAEHPGHNVTIGDIAFTPDTFTAAVEDTVTWIAGNGNANANNTMSTTIPGGATAWSSGPLTAGEYFWYVITDAGLYQYQSNTVTTFTADFFVTGVPTAVNQVADNTNKLIFQNPFGDQLRIYANQTGLISIYNVLGEKIADTRIENSGEPVDINTGGLSAGVYFISLYDAGGKALQTYKAIREN